MKTCANCKAANSSTAKFCNECGQALPRDEVSTARPEDFVDDLKKSILSKGAALQTQKRADIMFVLDCTGSMGGEIDAIKDTITDFADSIETDGVRVRVGLIEFRDRLIGEEHRVLSFADGPFTRDPKAFRRQVSDLEAIGGGDDPESSLDAVMLALRQPFDPEANKVIVLVTDAPPHIPDKETRSIEEVVMALLKKEVHQMYLVMSTQDPASQVYLRLLERLKGLAFDLGKGDDFRDRKEHFKRTLMALGKTISATTR